MPAIRVATTRRYDLYAAETVSSEASRDRQKPLLSRVHVRDTEGSKGAICRRLVRGESVPTDPSAQAAHSGAIGVGGGLRIKR